MSRQRATLLRRIRQAVLEALGDCCEDCGVTSVTLEIHHVKGCTWVQRDLNTLDRWRRYRRELESGVELGLLCRSCNAALNQWTYGTRKERN